MIKTDKRRVEEVGSCNFCKEDSFYVNVITGDTYLEVRMCSNCLRGLKKAKL